LDFYFFISSLNIRLVNLFFDVKFGLYSWNFFLILSFNIELVKNWVSQPFSIFFL
jgi:hypothetical protein